MAPRTGRVGPGRGTGVDRSSRCGIGALARSYVGVRRTESARGRNQGRHERDSRRRLRHDGKSGPSLGRTVQQETPGGERPGEGRRLRRRDCQPDRRQLRPGRHQPQDEQDRDSTRRGPNGAASRRRSSSDTTPWPSMSTRITRWTESRLRSLPTSTAKTARLTNGRNSA